VESRISFHHAKVGASGCGPRLKSSVLPREVLMELIRDEKRDELRRFAGILRMKPRRPLPGTRSQSTF
jgi:hypothetical protein